MDQYYIVHRDNPTEAIRVCRNSRSAAAVVASIGPAYVVTRGPVDRVLNRVVSDFMPDEQVFGRLS